MSKINVGGNCKHGRAAMVMGCPECEAESREKMGDWFTRAVFRMQVHSSPSNQARLIIRAFVDEVAARVDTMGCSHQDAMDQIMKEIQL